MRVATTIALDTKGKWHTLALPDVDPKDQRQHFKELNLAGGKTADGKMQFAEIFVLSPHGVEKRKRFGKDGVSGVARAKRKAKAKPADDGAE